MLRTEHQDSIEKVTKNQNEIESIKEKTIHNLENVNNEVGGMTNRINNLSNAIATNFCQCCHLFEKKSMIVLINIVMIIVLKKKLKN